MKVLVCGGRMYGDTVKVDQVLREIHARTPITHIIHGAAQGADSLAYQWAMQNGIQPVGCPALWSFYEKAAGPIRNAYMVALRPDLVVAFPGGRGTADMLSKAKEDNITCMVVAQ